MRGLPVRAGAFKPANLRMAFLGGFMKWIFGFLTITQILTGTAARAASTCFEADRLAKTKAALVHFFTNVDSHSCKNAARSDIYLSHDKEILNGRELIQFFIKCDQEYPVIGKIYWIESGCMASGRPAYFSSAQIVN